MNADPMPKPRSPAVAVGTVVVLLLAFTTFTTPSHATEEPEYQVVRELAVIEVRQWATYAVADVVVAGPTDQAGNQAFPILAGYILGKNKASGNSR